MGRIIGIDWGTVRVGVAMSDEEAKLSFPLQNPLPTKTAISEVSKLAEEYQVKKIIIGLPLSLSGEEGESAEKTKKFGSEISKQTGIEVEYMDERFSSVASSKALAAQDIKEKDQREIKDNIAAALMLQQYLEKVIK
ncbi:MAG: Holliday junction resolvase RuvX [Candidatus Doudnabacteria bacterium]|nr:Holliday junction resolvase RuvX [Candidatus Doudnabacteria bacterium]